MKKKWTLDLFKVVEGLYEDHTWEEISEILFKDHKFLKSPNAVRKAFKRYNKDTKILESRSPKILLFDIETLPMEAYIWSLWQDNVPLNMVKNDWSVLSYSAKWLGEDEIFYEDVAGQKDLRNDKKVLKGIWKLLDEADIIVGHNSKSFDTKKLNARFSLNGMQPPSSFRQLDTKQMAKKAFSHTSNKLSYLTDKYCTKYKKLSHGKFPGFSLWEQCLKRNPEAFAELEEYNKYDVLSLEELFVKLLPWDTSINFQVYSDSEETMCTCGSKKFKKSGFHYTNSCKYQKYKCTACGSEWRDRKNLLSKAKKDSMKINVRK